MRNFEVLLEAVKRNAPWNDLFEIMLEKIVTNRDDLAQRLRAESTLNQRAFVRFMLESAEENMSREVDRYNSGEREKLNPAVPGAITLVRAYRNRHYVLS